jgi:hypothetical protein
MGSSPSPALGLVLRPPPNPGVVYLSASQNPSSASSSIVSLSQRKWVGSKGPLLYPFSLNSISWVPSFSLSSSFLYAPFVLVRN